MIEVRSDQYRDPETMDRLKSIAARIFASHGIDFKTAKRAGGWSNATWLAGGLALRLSVQRGNETIRREAQLVALLPEEVGYPPILEIGVTDGYEWSLSKEITGRNLGDVWPSLDWNERVSALRQMWEKAQAVHSVDLVAVTDLARKEAWFNATDADEAEAALVRLVQQRVLNSRQVNILSEALDRFWQSLPAAACTLNHGDLTLDNLIWDAGKVVSLLDFEFAVTAPVELDLNALMACAFTPPDINDPLPDPGGAGLQRMRQVVTDLAIPVLSHQGGKDLLYGYAILLELWRLGEWLAHPEGEGPLEQWQPYRMLISLSDGYAGYLAPLLRQVDP